jgi:uncharacterized protein (TIGR03435 family)
MKPPDNNMDSALRKILQSTPQDQMEAAAARVLKQLRSDSVDRPEQLMGENKATRAAWRVLVVTAILTVLLVSAALAATLLFRPAKEISTAAPETQTAPPALSAQVSSPPVQAVKQEARLQRTVPPPAKPKTLQFEAAAIRPDPIQNTDEGELYMDCRGTNGRVRNDAAFAPPLGRCVGRHASVMTMISVAYGLEELDWVASLKAGNPFPPDWTNDPKRYGFQIEAKAENPTATTKEELQQMLQSLLADQFKLQVSWKTADVNGYVLTRAKDGPKLKEASTEEALTFTRTRSGSLIFSSVTGKASMKSFAEFLTGRLILLARVSDGTELPGIYEIKLSVSSQLAPPSDATPGGARGGPRGATDPSAPSPLQDALLDQMGLQLNEAKVPKQVIVVEHVEMPNKN